MSYAVRPVKPWTQVVNNAPAAVTRPPKRPSDEKNNRRKKKKKEDDDTVPRAKLSAIAIRSRDYGMKRKGTVLRALLADTCTFEIYTQCNHL